MVKYNLDHLTQDDSQKVLGPIQDDEALFLYSIIRGCRMRRIFEIGGGDGYSANNFLNALKYPDCNGIVYTCDINPVPVLATNHKVIIKNALDLTKEDIDNIPLDMIFFDCHNMFQMKVFNNFVRDGIINDNTVIAFHDTNLHYAPYNVWGNYIADGDGYAHQPVEREMVNILKNIGYDCFSISTTKDKHSENFPFRHGITVCQRFKRLN